MIKRHAHVVHMAKHMNMVGTPFGRRPWARAPFPLNPALPPCMHTQMNWKTIDGKAEVPTAVACKCQIRIIFSMLFL